MADNGIRRQLKAIFSADVKGYSRLMGDDDESTVKTITTYRKIIAELIETHQGRVVDSPGDNLLAEFGSTLNAVNSAIEIQHHLQTENGKLPDSRRMDFRIGINLGDIIHKDDRIYGDGVNVAARIESLADPGGICISRGVFDQVKNKAQQGFEYLGEHAVKNISDPVRIYRILLAPEFEGKVIGEPAAQRTRIRRPAAVAIAMLFVASILLLWMYYPRPRETETASIGNMAFPLPDRPSIAVLPFVNINKDPEQVYLSDGITEDIITTLSKVPKLLVIARDSTFTFKNRPVKVRQVAEELSVRYVLEGSIQKAGTKIRITAQLIDAVKGHHLWAERYDRELKDIFALQDEIAMKILAALEVKLVGGQTSLFISRGTDNLEAYLKALQGREFFERQDRENNFLARQKFTEALELDPNYAAAYNLLARTHFMDVWLGSSQSPTTSLATAIDLARKAISLEDSLADSHGLLGYLYSMTRQHDEAIAQGERAVQLDPNSSIAYFWLGAGLQYVGRKKEAVAMIEKAIRLNPIPPSAYYVSNASALYNTGRYNEAVTAVRKALALSPNNVFAYLTLAVTYSLAGRNEEARSAADEVLRIQPNFNIDKFSKGLPYKDPADVERIVGAMRRAGLQ
jgi:adenylate cyclase